MGYYFKYNYLKEREGSCRPVVAVSFLAEAPTGDDERGAGYGLANYTVNGILQKTLSTGEEKTGRGDNRAPQRRRDLRRHDDRRGAGFSRAGRDPHRRRVCRPPVHQPALARRGFRGAGSRNKDLGRGLLLGQVGGKYAFGERVTLDFGIIGGEFPASPSLGAQLGISIDLDTRLSEREE